MSQRVCHARAEIIVPLQMPAAPKRTVEPTIQGDGIAQAADVVDGFKLPPRRVFLLVHADGVVEIVGQTEGERGMVVVDQLLTENIYVGAIAATDESARRLVLGELH